MRNLSFIPWRMVWIRVMHRNSAMRALLRGHHHQHVSNIKFFSNDGKSGDVIGTIGNKKDTTTGVTGSTLIVWRVYEHSSSTEIGSERLLEISSDQLSFSSFFWHPFNQNQFFFTHHNASTSKQVRSIFTLFTFTLLLFLVLLFHPTHTNHYDMTIYIYIYPILFFVLCIVPYRFCSFLFVGCCAGNKWPHSILSSFSSPRTTLSLLPLFFPVLVFLSLCFPLFSPFSVLFFFSIPIFFTPIFLSLGTSFWYYNNLYINIYLYCLRGEDRIE